MPLLTHIASARRSEPAPTLALLFHIEMSAAACAGAEEMRRLTRLGTISLSGGVFQNVLLRGLRVPRLEASGFDVRLNLAIPPGDGGLAVEQAYREV